MTTLISSAFCHGTSMSSTLNHAKPHSNDQANSQPSEQPSKQSNQQLSQQLLQPRVVINTRPVERAAPLTQHLQSAGLSVVEMPMLALQSRLTTDDDMALMRQWLAGDYQALVIVSPTAAASGLAIWQALERQAREHEGSGNEANKDHEAALQSLKAPSHLIAVGDATAAVLNNAKIDAASYQVLQPGVANNEGMLAMPEVESLQAGDKLLVWRGLGGRRLLVNTLQARGVHIDSIAWYERKMPLNAKDEYKQWLTGLYADNLKQTDEPLEQAESKLKPIVIVSSGTAFEHWSRIVAEVTATDEREADEGKSERPSEPQLVSETNHRLSLKLSDFVYVVLGERLANMVAEQQLSHWRVEDLAPETILAAINSTEYSC